MLPVIGRADELTVGRLAECKAAVRREMRELGVGWGAFAPNGVAGASSEDSALGAEDEEPARRGGVETDDGGQASSRLPSGMPVGVVDDEEDDTPKASAMPYPSPPPEPVKLIRVRSRSRGMVRSANYRPVVPEVTSDEEEEDEGEVDYGGMVPFAVVAPEEGAATDERRFVREFR